MLPEDVICRPLEKLVKQNRMPALFIGAGFSKRYLQNYPRWDELLVDIGQQLGLKKFNILNEIKVAKSTCATEGLAYQQIATLLEGCLNKIIRDEKESLVFNAEDIQYLSTNSCSAFKYLVCKNFNTMTFKNEPKYLNVELNYFRQLKNKVSAVFTTNYDTLIERLFDGEFKKFINQSDYFYSDSNNYAEIYKLHGCITDPNSIILTEADYNNFNKIKHFTSAKLLSLLSTCPIIFIGYALRDYNINQILENMVSCLTEKQLDQLKDNIFYIDWKDHAITMNYSTKEIPLPSRSFNVTCIETNNFARLFDYLNKITPSATPSEIRKCLSLIKKLVMTADKSIDTVIAASKDLNNLSIQNNLVVAVGEATTTAATKTNVSAKRFHPNQLILDALFNKNEILCDEAFEWTQEHFSPGNWAPLFYYIAKDTAQIAKNYPRVQEFCTKRKGFYKSYSYKKGYLIPERANITTHLLKFGTTDSKLQFLMDNYLNNKITKECYREQLQMLYNSYNPVKESENKKPRKLTKIKPEDKTIFDEPNFKKAVVLIDYL